MPAAAAITRDVDEHLPAQLPPHRVREDHRDARDAPQDDRPDQRPARQVNRRQRIASRHVSPRASRDGQQPVTAMSTPVAPYQVALPATSSASTSVIRNAFARQIEQPGPYDA